MIPSSRIRLHSSVFSVALTTAALILTLLMRPVIEPNVFLLFFAAVLIGAWYHGWAGGLVTTALSTLAALYFFVTPVSWLILSSRQLLIRLGSFIGVSLLITWLTASWHRSQQLLAATLYSIGDAVIATDEQGRITFLNPVAEVLTGWRQSEARKRPLGKVLRLLDARNRKELESPVEKALRESAVVTLPSHAILVSKDGNEILIEDSAGPIRDDSEKLKGAILVFRDVTGRRQLEEQLSHSQKMDAVGRLAGGVAGDFNNVLTVITGYSELLRAEAPAGTAQRRFADEIMYAAERAAGLTRQLLAFSRGHGAQPRALDLNTMIHNMEPMLSRMLGDDIELLVLPGPGLARVLADPAHIEQVVMNLANNARDAMPTGGKLVIETGNVDLDEEGAAKIGAKPGSYVMLSVSDTGIGMDAETRSRLFEPFFTTKEPGKGSGLGLSTVYGIVRQSEGYIGVYSQVGCGTIFEIYLPLAKDPVVVGKSRQAGVPKGSETILLVDDEEGVRKLVQAVLKANGYTVIEASNGPAALASFEKNAHKIDLVLTDVVMPQMNGFELVQRLTEKNPLLKILYMSGYRDNPIGNMAAERQAFLHKPFTPDILLGKVREVLDARPV